MRSVFPRHFRLQNVKSRCSVFDRDQSKSSKIQNDAIILEKKHEEIGTNNNLILCHLLSVDFITLIFFHKRFHICISTCPFFLKFLPWSDYNIQIYFGNSLHKTNCIFFLKKKIIIEQVKENATFFLDFDRF